MSYETVKKGVYKRKGNRVVGVFVDGVGLDRASRKFRKKIDFQRLLKGLSPGINPIVARYYTIIPHQDDQRQLAFLDAVEKSGLELVRKRLPPKDIDRQVSIDVEISSDIVAFGHGFFDPKQKSEDEKKSSDQINRVAVVVCPSYDLAYPMTLLKEAKIDTVTANFDGGKKTRNVLHAAAKWIDLSTTEDIWKE